MRYASSFMELMLEVILFVVMCCSGMVGALLIFGSFFFEKTWAQVTWWDFGENFLLFLGGVVLGAIALTIAERLAP
jgi:hypothetical protein